MTRLREHSRGTVPRPFTPPLLSASPFAGHARKAMPDTPKFKILPCKNKMKLGVSYSQ